MSAMPRGFTIIEIGISLMILGILLALGLPSFSAWIGNTQIRSGGEAVLNGIQLARSEAVRRNLNTQFVLTEAAATPPTTGWMVQVMNSAGVVTETVQTRSHNEGSPNAQVVIAPGAATTLTFNGMGRVLAKNADLSDAITQIDIVNPGGGACEVDGGTMRCLQIRVGMGSVRMCDPKVAAGDPRAC
jgi:type IV fimbrial biogenesis protein FimT